MDFCQQDKGMFFPSNWHVIKDIPNLQFRHMILENNENKPVTNSRAIQQTETDEVVQRIKPGDLKSIVASLQSVALEGGKPKEGLSSVVAAKERSPSCQWKTDGTFQYTIWFSVFVATQKFNYQKNRPLFFSDAQRKASL